MFTRAARAAAQFGAAHGLRSTAQASIVGEHILYPLLVAEGPSLTAHIDTTLSPHINSTIPPRRQLSTSPHESTDLGPGMHQNPLVGRLWEVRKALKAACVDTVAAVRYIALYKKKTRFLVHFLHILQLLAMIGRFSPTRLPLSCI